MRTTVTEEYEDGQLVRRTTVTEGEPATGGYVWSKLDRSCTCGVWMGVTPPSPCPMHGQAIMPTVTINTSTTKTPGEIAAEVGRQLRSTG